MSDHVFICYAREDEDFVLQLADNLRARGVPIWIDQRDIPAGADWDVTIDDALYDCAHFLIVLSPQSIASDEVRSELRVALNEKKTIIPVLYQKCRVPRQLMLKQHVDFIGREPDDQDGLGQVLAALGVEWSQAPTPERPAAARPQPEPEPELHPSLALELSVEPQTVGAGDEAKWMATLRNDGDDNLRRVIVRRARTLLDDPFDFAAGKERRFTFTTTYETEGEQTEKVTATGVASNGEGVRDEASATVQVRAVDRLTITSPIQLELMRVPAGEFLMGSDKSKDKDAYGDEQPQYSLHVSEFYIGKYPVTVAQFRTFVEDSGYEPGDKDSPGGQPDHPVVWVSWHEAVAFCRWLSQETGKEFRLPTEAEWEKAARGTDGRIYPWGNQSPDSKRLNFDGNVGDTTPVGKYSPQGDSPYKAADMAGNVWEWTQSLWGKDSEKPEFGYPYDPQDGRENLDAPDEIRRVVRGGSFSRNRRGVRCAARYGRGPLDRDNYRGFRVCVPASPFPR